MFIIQLERQLVDQLTAYCTSRMPEEACGILEGLIIGEQINIQRFIPVSNRSDEPTISFIFDAEEWVSIVLNHEIKLVGTFHSHPTSAAYPSIQDLNTSWDQLPVHLIIGMKTTELYAYQIFTKEPPTATECSKEFNSLEIHINPQV